MSRSKDNRTDGDIHNTTCVVEPEVDTSPKSTYSKINQALEGKDRDRNSGTVKRYLLKWVVHGIKEEWNLKVHTRSSAGEQGDNPQCWNWSKYR